MVRTITRTAFAMAKDTSEPAQHVPAWKKLGLKLKYAKETNEDDTPMNEAPEPTEKSDKAESKEKKKRKKSSEQGDGEEATKKKRRHDDKDDEKKKKKKRVSFGPDTKSKDGGSSSDSDADDEGDSSETVTASEEPEPEPKMDEKEIEDMKKRKREKKKERKNKDKTGSSAPAHVHETPILSYLSHYYRDRATWKFQKNRETNLFKHLYSLEHVPTLYNAALLTYLQGLKGDAAKARLRQGAAEVIKADMEAEKKGDGENTESVDEGAGSEYQKAVDAFRSSLSSGDMEELNDATAVESFDADTQKRLQKRHRAELVFFAVAEKVFVLEKPAPKKEQPENKKRKNRTAVVEISSSSESEETSSSGSDSDSDSDEASSSETKPTPKKTASSESSDETSSSGSSSSESDSEDDTSAPMKKPAAKNPTPAAKKEQPATTQAEQPYQPSKPTPKNKKKQKRKVRTAQIEISSSSESDSD